MSANKTRRLLQLGFLLVCLSHQLTTSHSSFLALTTSTRSDVVSAAADRRRSSTSTRMSAASNNGPSSDGKKKKVEQVVIAGAGIQGICTAYYLAVEHGVRTTLVDPTGTIAPAASGKAGGFLAKTWNDGSPTGPLTHRSFDLHQALADRLGADTIQYRRLTCAAISVASSSSAARTRVRRPGGKKLEGVEWAATGDDNGPVLGMRPIGDEETIAQVHPKMLCERLWGETSKSINDGGVGSTLRRGKVVGVAYEDDKSDGDSRRKLIGAQLDDGSVVEGDAVLFACGPWRPIGPPMYGVKYHSAVIPTDRELNQCVFFSGCGDPEVYVRPDSTAYCTGFPEPARLVTEEPGEVAVQPEKIAEIVQSVRKASGGSGGAGGTGPLDKDTVVEQSCYLPMTADSVPVMGLLPVDAVGGGQAYISAGHGCWGILLGPASGEAMANLIVTGDGGNENRDVVDLRPFTPSRFPDIRPAS